jgi:hypothetical protein
MPEPSATAKVRLGPLGLPMPYIDRSPAGKAETQYTLAADIDPDSDDLMLIRPL